MFAGAGWFQPRTFLFTVHEGGAKSLRVRADSRVAQSVGALTPLGPARDDEALGAWRNE
jgi:hypothetical protein